MYVYVYMFEPLWKFVFKVKIKHEGKILAMLPLNIF